MTIAKITHLPACRFLPSRALRCEVMIAHIGSALYGPRWQSELARVLGVSDRTMRRWAAGAEVPIGAQSQLQLLLRRRIGELGDLLDEPL